MFLSIGLLFITSICSLKGRTFSFPTKKPRILFPYYQTYNYLVYLWVKLLPKLALQYQYVRYDSTKTHWKKQNKKTSSMNESVYSLVCKNHFHESHEGGTWINHSKRHDCKLVIPKGYVFNYLPAIAFEWRWILQFELQQNNPLYVW